MGQNVSFLPKFIIIRMFDNLLPKEIIIMEFFGDVLERHHPKEEIVGIGGGIFIKPHQLIGIPRLAREAVLLIAENGESRRIAFQIGALMMKIIEEKVSDRGLGR